MSLINNLGKISILNEAQNDELFDIDKEVDAHLKRVENRIAKKQSQDSQQQNTQTTEEDNSQEEISENTNIQDQDEQEPETADTDSTQSDDTNGEQSDEYDYMDGEDTSQDDTDDIPDNYEPKQTIPELRVLSTLSDKEYSLCNLKILDNFDELKRNVNSTINNLIPSVTTKTSRQRQVMSIVKKNLYQMLEDIDHYIMYKNTNIYEENVKAYLTYLKRYQIATNIIKLVLDENICRLKDK